MKQIKEFLESKKNTAFLTSEATRNNITKRQLKNTPGVIRLSTIPISIKNGRRLEGLWAYDFELEKLVKQAKKSKTKEQKEEFLKKIEEVVSAKLGFSNNEMEENNGKKKEG